MLNDPEELLHTIDKDQNIYPVCAIIRSMAIRRLVEESKAGVSTHLEVPSDGRNTGETGNTKRPLSVC